MENEGSEKEKKDGELRRGENRGERLRVACIVRGLHTYTGCPARTCYLFDDEERMNLDFFQNWISDYKSKNFDELILGMESKISSCKLQF